MIHSVVVSFDLENVNNAEGRSCVMRHKWLTLLTKYTRGKLSYGGSIKNTTSVPYGYLLIDQTQETDEKLKPRTVFISGHDMFLNVRKL